MCCTGWYVRWVEVYEISNFFFPLDSDRKEGETLWWVRDRDGDRWRCENVSVVASKVVLCMFSNSLIEIDERFSFKMNISRRKVKWKIEYQRKTKFWNRAILANEKKEARANCHCQLSRVVVLIADTDELIHSIVSWSIEKSNRRRLWATFIFRSRQPVARWVQNPSESESRFNSHLYIW